MRAFFQSQTVMVDFGSIPTLAKRCQYRNDGGKIREIFEVKVKYLDAYLILYTLNFSIFSEKFRKIQLVLHSPLEDCPPGGSCSHS